MPLLFICLHFLFTNLFVCLQGILTSRRPPWTISGGQTAPSTTRGSGKLFQWFASSRITKIIQVQESGAVWQRLQPFQVMCIFISFQKKSREIEFQFHEIFNVQMFVYIYLFTFTGILEILRRWLQNYTFQSALGVGQPLSRPHGKIWILALMI